MDAAPKRPKHPFFARIYDPLLAKPAERWEGRFREELCATARGLVLEIGAGTGMNFPYYAKARRVVATEPEGTMLKRAAGKRAAASVPVVLMAAAAERLPFADTTFDTVICSLVLCTVANQTEALRELRRILKPGGTLRLFEHVRSTSPRAARWQDRLARPWGVFGGGCHPNRDTLGELTRHGFSVRFRALVPPIPGAWFVPHVIGEARLDGAGRPEASTATA
jgi:SAM-dependent methyltransferase